MGLKDFQLGVTCELMLICFACSLVMIFVPYIGIDFNLLGCFLLQQGFAILDVFTLPCSVPHNFL